jgi:hypothetical protein
MKSVVQENDTHFMCSVLHVHNSYGFQIITQKRAHISESTNALALDLPDNSETTHRLKRYTVLTLPDRLEWNPNTRIEVIPKWTKENCMSYLIEHNSFTSQYLLAYIYCRFCRLCIINCENKKYIIILAIYMLTWTLCILVWMCSFKWSLRSLFRTLVV